jgi:hypothetical protein
VSPQYQRIDFTPGSDAGNDEDAHAHVDSLWDRDHYTAFHSYPSQENRERLVGLAVAECKWATAPRRPPR